MINQFLIIGFSLVKHEDFMYLHQDTNYEIPHICCTKSYKKSKVTGIQDEAINLTE